MKTGTFRIRCDQYDFDGNLTQETDYPGLGAANRVTDYWYDWRDRLVAEKDGVESNENDGVYRPIIVTTYDNLDEATSTQQYLGDNVTPQIANGELVPLDSSLLRAEEIDNYDDQGRVFQTLVYDVNPSTGAVSRGALTTNYYYDHRGNLIAESDPGGLWTKSQYDGAGRDVMDYTTDGGGGTTWTAASSVAKDTVLEQEQTVYDGDGNVIETIDSQRFHNATGTGALGTPTSGVGARVYYAANYYDNADRLIASVDAGTNGGAAWTRPPTVPTSSPQAPLLVTQYQYNAAGWVQDAIDPMGIDTRTLYDNLGRAIKSVQVYTGGPPGTENNVTTEYGYDGNNNVIYVQADEPTSNQKTAYVYGVTTASGSGVNSNDILSAIQHPDPNTGQPSSSQQDTYLVNALGQVVQSTDRNGNVHQYSYDVLGRPTADKVTTFGAGVDQSVAQITYAYDSQGNVSDIQSVNGGSTTVNDVQRAFNGLGQLTSETQSHGQSPAQAVQYAYNEMANGENNSRLVSMTYPNGYVLNYNYNSGLNDSISRLSSLSDSNGTVESYLYLGLDTVVERDHPLVTGDSLNLSYIQQTGDTQANHDGGDQYTGLDRFGRVIDQYWLSTGSQSPGTMDRYQYGYNADSEVLYRQNLVDTAMSELYSYDNLGQLTSFARGTLNATKTGISGTPSRSQSWTPDALGNFTNVTTNGTVQSRTANQQNEYTAIGSQSPTYDADGNLTADGNGNSYVYDAWNRLVAVKNNGSTVASYSYDGLNRLIQVTEGGTTTDLYYSSSDQVLAEYQGGTAVAYNVWSPVYVNALVFRAVGSGYSAQRYYALQDANWNVTALENGTGGVVVERYAYDPFGAVTVLNPNFTVRGASNFDVPYGYQDMRVDWFVGLNITNGRIYDPALMRWLQTDPLGQVTGNNGYAMEGNGPTDAVDPSGLQEQFPKSAGQLTNGLPRVSPEQQSRAREAVERLRPLMKKPTEPTTPVELMKEIHEDLFPPRDDDELTISEQILIMILAHQVVRLPPAGGRMRANPEGTAEPGRTRGIRSQGRTTQCEDPPVRLKRASPKGAGGQVPSLKGNVPDPMKWIKSGGRVIYHRDGSITYIKNGISIKYNSLGYPDFSGYLYKGTDGLSQVRIKLTGSRRLDEAAANAAAGFKKTPDGYIWHHHEDTGLMQLVREDVHSEWWHSGGFSLNK